MIDFDYINLGDYRFITRVALTPSEQARGLMHEEIPEILSFPYADAAVRKFWMKNTPAALEILFVYRHRLIDIQIGVPFSTEQIGPDSPCDLVVEVPLGFCKATQLKIGDRVTLDMSLETLHRQVNLQIAS